MKKIILFSILCIGSTAIFAQNEAKAKTEVTAKLASPVSVAPAAASMKTVSAEKAMNVQSATSTLAVADVVDMEGLALKQTEHDFGKIPQGKPVTYDFVVSNSTKAAFKLDNVQASCGCTTPEWNKDEMINPGAEAKIKVGYNAAAPGPFNKTITITYNGTQTKQIFIKGEVWNTPAASAPENTTIKDLN